MNRGLVMTLCAAALAAGSLAHAQAPNVNLSLNLRYNTPSVPANGGTWYLVAKTDSAVGIAAVNAYITGINSAGIIYGTGAATTFGAGVGGTPTTFGNYSAVTGTNIAAELNNASQPFVVVSAGQPTNIVYFQDTANGPVEGGGAGGINVVGGAAFTERQATDPLRNTGVNTAPGVVGGNWNNATVIASGTFGATRPAFAPKGGNSTDANVLATVSVPSNNAIDATVTTTVRGDSLVIGSNGLTVPSPLESPAGAGLRWGDRNRNGVVAFGTDIQTALTFVGTGAGKVWDQGDFNGNGTVSFGTDIQPALAQISLPATPAPAVGAVPEPASMTIVLASLAGLATARRRK